MADELVTQQPAEGQGTPVVQQEAAPSWYAGLDQVTRGQIEQRGWNTKQAHEVVGEALAAMTKAEGFVGAPADKLLRIPDQADAAGWAKLRQQLGAPADAAGYDFKDVKRGDQPVDQGFQDFARKLASDLGLSQAHAVQAASEIVKYMDGVAAAQTAEQEAALASGKAELAKNWGANAEANMFIAKQAAAKLGVTPEQVTALEKVVGYAKVMDLFRDIGTKIGEDRFVANTQAPSGVMTRDAAVARKKELMQDSAWTKRYLDGDAAANKEMTALNVIITGEAGEYQPA